ncbi:MAG TPA: TOBE domain-containing protein [Caldimonas sp.]|nr:TOBE domain-containing protein [Caldimonas sp.]
MTAHRRRLGRRLGLQGSIWISVGDEALGGSERFALLHAIAREGSITRAAKASGVSYKSAWQAIDAMNALAGEPLVERIVGGRGGGSTRLTPRGQQLLDRFAQIDAAHRRFLHLLDARSIDLDHPFSLLAVLNMKTSARNQFVGTVCGYRAGAVNDEVELALPAGPRIVAVVTRESTEQMGLKLGASAFALIKASSVLIATDLEGARLSARNQLAGRVVSVSTGAVNAEVVVDVGADLPMAAIITQASAKAMGLRPGRRVSAVFKASSVILGAMV